MPRCTGMWKTSGSAAILATKRLAGVAPEMNLREYVACMPPPSANKAAHSGFETKKPKTGYQGGPHKKDL